MSRLYFNSEDGTAELHGSERHWLRQLSHRPGVAAWDLNRTLPYEQARKIIEMVPEKNRGYLGELFHSAAAAETQARQAWAAWGALPAGERFVGGPTTSHDRHHSFVEMLKMVLATDGVRFEINGTPLYSTDVELNTALAVGSDAICLAAKLHGYCELHAWIDGPDRAWVADLIDQGLETGVFRRGFWHVDRPCDGRADEQPDRRWSTQGWEEVQELLRARDDLPVVTSYSVCDDFPNETIAGWEPPPMPEGWRPDWASDAEGLAVWERKYPDADARQEHYRTTAYDRWFELPAAEQWAMALAGLKRQRPWAQITPKSLRGVTFGLGVTVYGLLGPDRDDRVAAAVLAEQSEAG